VKRPTDVLEMMMLAVSGLMGATLAA